MLAVNENIESLVSAWYCVIAIVVILTDKDATREEKECDERKVWNTSIISKVLVQSRDKKNRALYSFQYCFLFRSSTQAHGTEVYDDK